MKPIKVLILVPNLRVSNGVTSFIMNYFNDLDHRKVQMDFALYSDRETPCYETIRQQSGKVFILPDIKKLQLHIKVCNEILSKGQYDIVHDNTLHVSIPMMWCAKKAGVPVRILHSHNSKMGETPIKALRNKVFLPVLRSLATDYAACSQLAGHAMFGSQEFAVIPNVIQTEKYHFDSMVREHVRQNMNVQDKFVVGTVGRLAEQKNPFFAIDVFAELLKKVPNSEYWWVGSGPLQEQVKAYIEEKKLTKYIKLLGSRSDTVELYQGMDVFFLPSLFEGLSIVTVEAQAMGLPCVISDEIPPEAEYTDLIKRVALKQPKEFWVEQLQDSRNEHLNRNIYHEELMESNFSDIECGDNLEQFFCSKVKEKRRT